MLQEQYTELLSYCVFHMIYTIIYSIYKTVYNIFNDLTQSPQYLQLHMQNICCHEVSHDKECCFLMIQWAL